MTLEQYVIKVLTGELVLLPVVYDDKRTDISYLSTGDRHCRSVSPNGYRCTRYTTHRGVHISRTASWELLEQWPRS